MEALLGNALKFQHEGATPDVEVRSEPLEDGQAYRFTVEDDGIGVDEDYHERIFVLFQRLHPRGQFEGTGIGLALCKKIVENHEGRIWVDSSPGEGSRFHFVLPAAPPQSPSTHGSAG